MLNVIYVKLYLRKKLLELSTERTSLVMNANLPFNYRCHYLWYALAFIFFALSVVDNYAVVLSNTNSLSKVNSLTGKGKSHTCRGYLFAFVTSEHL